MNKEYRAIHIIAIILDLVLILTIAFALSSKACAYSPEFETNAQNFVAKYRPTFLPYYGYFLEVCEEYGFTEYEVASLTGIMKMETMFGKTGHGRQYNYGGMRGKKGFYAYKNEFDGVNAITLNWKHLYSGKGDLYWQLNKWVAPVSKKYLDDVKRTIRLLTK